MTPQENFKKGKCTVFVSGEVISRTSRNGFSIAHDNIYRNKQGDVMTETNYFEVETNEPLPSIGEMILIEGSLSSYKIEDKNNKYKTVILASKIIKLGNE